VSTLVPPLFEGLVDDASTVPFGGPSVAEAVAVHRTHRDAWYAAFVGPMLVPASAVVELARVVEPAAAGPAAADHAGGPLVVGLIGDTGIPALPAALARVRTSGAVVRQIEVAVAKRGEDPQPGLARLSAVAADEPDLEVYAEIPLTWGLLAALDTVAAERAAGARIAPKFRTGGLAAELFPTPVELAAVICACRDRELPFKLTAGLHHALRHTDPETGFAHHGFLNVLVAAAVAVDGAEVADVAEVLGATHPLPLVEPARARRAERRPLWLGFGASAVLDPLTDLLKFGLINGGAE
jgi:hypothetical protein